MLKSSDVDRIVLGAAKSHLRGEVRRVFSEPAVDWTGEDAVRVTIVIEPGAADRITGRSAADTLVEIQQQLHRAGEARFPIVQYATEDELAEVDGT